MTNNDGIDPTKNPVCFLQKLFAVALENADPFYNLVPHLPKKPKGRAIVIGAGKASLRMAEAVETKYSRVEGIVIVPYGYDKQCRDIKIIQASHPIPDHNGLRATKAIINLVSNLTSDDLVIAVISGGGSALLVQPIAGISLEEKQQVFATLLKSGAPISDINIVRKHLSSVKGGKLAALCSPATVMSYLVSDIPGDKASLIASGPTISEQVNKEQLPAILAKWRVNLSSSTLKAINKSSMTSVTNPQNTYKIIISPKQAFRKVINYIENHDCEVIFLGDALEGEAKELGVEQACLAKKISQKKAVNDKPIVLLSGGECTVSVTGNGNGGPNVEFALSAVLELNGAPNIYLIACDSDGVDGMEKVAGAIVSPSIIHQAKSQQLDPNSFLENNDCHTFFEKVNARVITGPTNTNINDIRAFLIL